MNLPDNTPAFTILGSSRRRTLLQTLWIGCTLAVLVYSIAVLTHVATMGTIGVRCLFGTELEEEIPDDYGWHNARPRIGDSLLAIGKVSIRDGSYSDYIKALRSLSAQVGKTIEVQWKDQHTREVKSAWVEVKRHPTWTYYRSWVWFFQELLIFAIGARVFWKRPNDDSARLFFALCIVTVGAFMGGYHWTEIVTEAVLIYLFALFAPVRPRGEFALLPGFPPAQPNPSATPTSGLGVALRYLHGVSRAHLGEHAGGSMAGLVRGRLANLYRLPRRPLAGVGVHRLGGAPVRNVHFLHGVKLPQRQDAR